MANRAIIKVVTGTTAANGGVVTVPYPDGFDVDNTAVSGISINTSGIWRELAVYGSSYGVVVSRNSLNIFVSTSRAETANCPFKLTLLREG